MLDVVVGLQFGDEGKGKCIDYLCSEKKYKYLIRCNGGSNAGHTVVENGNHYIFNYLCSGLINEKNYDYMALCNGIVVHPIKLMKEILKYKRFNLLNKLKISDEIHLVLNKHIIEDEKDCKIGTTKQGIGPCMKDKISRIGIRIKDYIKDKNILKDESIEYINAIEFLIFNKLIYSSLEKDIREDIKTNDSLLEISQGTLLDPYFGYYPFVTTTRTCVPGVLSILGISYKHVKNIIGVFKSYITRVGNGRFDSEIKDTNISEVLVKEGSEYGTVTKRHRRIGWLNIKELKSAIEINDCTDLFITKIDILQKLDNKHIEIKILEKNYITYRNKRFINSNIDFDLKYTKYIEKLLCKDIKYISNGFDRSSLWIKRNAIYGK